MDPIKKHKTFLEELVRRTPSVGASNIRSFGRFCPAKGSEPLNELVQRLNPQDRDLLAKMLEQERQNGIFDVLSYLAEQCDTQGGLRLTVDGQEIPHEPFGYTLFEEYITLLDDERGWAAMEES